MADPTVDWDTRVVHVPQSFLTFLSGDSYQLDTNAFRIAINDIEDSQAGVVHPQIIVHKTSTTLDGIEYARIIEIVNNYTITFEETGTPYKVFLNGSNNNILTVTNLGTVQVAPSNSAGLINLIELQHGVFQDAAHVDQTNSSGSAVSGTTYPTGTPIQPSDNFPDLALIAQSRGFDELHIIGDATLDTGDNVEGYTLVGQNAVRTTITINAGASTAGCEILEAFVTGNLDGGTILRNCVIENLNYVNGFVHKCMLNPGTISLGGSTTAHFLDCYSGVPGTGTPTIDMNGTGAEDTPLAIRGYNGGIKLIQKTGTGAVSIDLASGQVVIDSTCVAGTIVVRGDGKVVDETGAHMNSGTYNGGLTVINEANFGEHTHDIWQRLGLDSANPVTNYTDGSFDVGNIDVNATEDGSGNITQTRQ